MDAQEDMHMNDYNKITALYDPQGCPHSQVDDDLRRRLETKLIIAILDFDLT